MKKLLFILSVFCFSEINGQNVLTLTPGVTISSDLNGVITLENMDLINEGYSTPVKIRFSGNANSTISGAGGPYGITYGINYDGLDIAKTGGAKLILLSQITSVHRQIIFTSGYLDLNGHILDLSNDGGLVGESENSRIIGPSGGYVQYFQQNTTVPGSSTGVIYESPHVSHANVRRGHVIHTGNLGTGSGIQRYFYMHNVSTYSGLPGTISVRLKYFESELNGLNENDLVFWSSSNLVSWTNRGYTNRNTTDNYVELSNSFPHNEVYYTLAPAGSSRPTTSAPQQIKTIAVPGKETIINKWKTWPNPADKILWIDITSASASQATTSIFDSKGSLIRIQTNHLMEGSNKLRMDLKSLAAGIYYITTTWDAGKQKRSSNFVKL